MTYTAINTLVSGSEVAVTLDGYTASAGTTIVPLTLDGYAPGEDPPDDPPPGGYTPPTFTHGDQLTASNIGYLPWGETLTTVSGDQLITTGNQTIRNRRYTGYVEVAANNVIFERCHFYEMVSNFENSQYHFEIWDSEIGPPTGWSLSGFSLASSTQGAVGRYNFLLRRCYIHDWDEGPRMQMSCSIIECFIDRIHRPEPLAHCDGSQTYGANGGVSGGTGLNIIRTRYNCRMYNDSRVVDPTDYASSCYQCGDFPVNMAVTVQNNLFEGATIGLRCYDAVTGSGLTHSITGNKFVRGSFQMFNGVETPASTENSAPGNVTWSNNTWSDNGQVISAP
jgi:hypothetical protein